VVDVVAPRYLHVKIISNRENDMVTEHVRYTIPAGR
jgi:hypothetical protein